MINYESFLLYKCDTTTTTSTSTSTSYYYTGTSTLYSKVYSSTSIYNIVLLYYYYSILYITRYKNDTKVSCLYFYYYTA